MTYIKIGSDEFEPGCYVEDHWGQYGPDHMADKFDHVLDIAPDDDPRVLRARAEAAEAAEAASLWERHHEATDKLVDRLNDMTPDGYVWDWVDGEFFLMPLCDNEDDCTDETCAHWAYA